jgi:hypothetical protein
MCRRPRQITILPLVEAISLALGGEFKVYLSQLIPQILRIFHYDDSEKRTSTVCDQPPVVIHGSLYFLCLRDSQALLSLLPLLL